MAYLLDEITWLRPKHEYERPGTGLWGGCGLGHDGEECDLVGIDDTHSLTFYVISSAPPAARSLSTFTTTLQQRTVRTTMVLVNLIDTMVEPDP